MRAFLLTGHLIGLVMWLGTLLVGTRLCAIAVKSSEPGSSVSQQLAKASTLWILVGLGLSTITGLGQILNYGVAEIFAQHWFHGKLTLVLGLFALTFFALKSIGRMRSGDSVPFKKLMMLHGIAGIFLVLIVAITMFGRY